MSRGMLGLSVAALIAAAACGGGSNGGGGNPNGPSSGGSPPQSGATITIGTNGAVNPAQVTVSVGQSVTFTNNSNLTRNISSDPHPAHTDCDAFRQVGLLNPGQTKQTGAFTTARTCGFHDHDLPNDAGGKGSIIVR